MRSKNRSSGQRSFIEAARRAQLVECAIGVIAERGYARASLAEIASRAGISKSVVLYHFKGKDALIDQVVRDVYAAGSAAIEPRLRAASDARAALRAYLEGSIAFVRDNPKSIRALGEIFANARTDDGTHRYSSPANEPIATTERILRDGQRTGQFRTFSAPVMARAIRSVLDDIAVQFTADPGLDLDACTRELVTLFELATTTEEERT